jgi:hypothetical protein
VKVSDNSKIYLISLIFSNDFERFPINLELFNNLKSIHFLNKFSPNFLINIKEIKIDLVPVDLQIDLLEIFFHPIHIQI